MKFKEQKAIYLQIVDYVLENILAREWPPDERIPSARDMASAVGVNPNTVMRAYSYLQDHEIIYMRRGVGFFVDEEGLEKTRALKRKEFQKETLPELFKMMQLLEIDFSDLEQWYREREQVA